MLKKPRKYVLYRCEIGTRGTGPSTEAAQKKQVDVICHFFEKYDGNICFRRKNGLLSYKNKKNLNLLVIYMYNWDFQLWFFSKHFIIQNAVVSRFNEYYVKYPGFVGCGECYFQNYWKKGCFWQKYPNFNCFYMSGTNDFLINWSINALGIVKFSHLPASYLYNVVL